MRGLAWGGAVLLLALAVPVRAQLVGTEFQLRVTELSSGGGSFASQNFLIGGSITGLLPATSASENFRIRGSAAVFEPLVPKRARGDVTGNGVVDVEDAVLALRIIVGFYTPTPEEIMAGDVYPVHPDRRPGGDGIDVNDVAHLLRAIVGIVPL
jgi:hypothetical protein